MTAAQALSYEFAATQQSNDRVQLQCPTCAQALGWLNLQSSAQQASRVCPRCHFALCCEDGIWRALPPSRAAHFSSFIADYEFIRNAEGRGSYFAAYYLALPDYDLTGKNSAQWAIRARTFHYLRRHILPILTAKRSHPLRILDLGAGNGWLSAHLARLGHHPVAVDLLTNPADGLAAARHFRSVLPHLFPRFQAEHERLPFASASFDLILFNASFHYSEDYERTLRESLRCLAPGGSLLIADTPWYSCEQSGAAMIAERRKLFGLRFGIPSDSLTSLEFLTNQRLAQLSSTLRLRWHIHRPWYGLRWAFRPPVARLLRRREPSRFYLYLAERA